MADDKRWLRRIGVTADPDEPPPVDNHAADGKIDTEDLAGPVDLDTRPASEDGTPREMPAPAPRRFTPWVAVVFGAAAVIATAITAGAAALAASHASPGSKALTADQTPPALPPAPAPPTATPDNADHPIPFTASADCPSGSTAAQSVADPQAKSPWICARTVDGQVLHIDLGRAYVITAVSIVPGARTGGDDATDPWLQHRVVTRIQWQFNDTDKTVRTQNTGNVRGEAVLPVPNVLASTITAIILQTSRPPATAPTSTAPPTDGLPGPLLDTPTPLPGGPPPPDPSDGTFAVTTIKVIGHQAN